MSDEGDNTSREMPKYKCHKEVWALKISAIEGHEDGSATIAPKDEGYASFFVPGFMERFKGDDNDMGYYVVYEDGYISWSPTEVFEKGYSQLK